MKAISEKGSGWGGRILYLKAIKFKQ